MNHSFFLSKLLIRSQKNQGWEFAPRFPEQITCFLPKNERMSDLLKKMSDSLIRSFLVSDLSNSLTSLIFSERPEQFAHIAHQTEERSESLIFF